MIIQVHEEIHPYINEQRLPENDLGHYLCTMSDMRILVSQATYKLPQVVNKKQKNVADLTMFDYQTILATILELGFAPKVTFLNWQSWTRDMDKYLRMSRLFRYLIKYISINAFQHNVFSLGPTRMVSSNFDHLADENNYIALGTTVDRF